MPEVIGEMRTRYDRVYTHAGVAIVIATPKECQESN